MIDRTLARMFSSKPFALVFFTFFVPSSGFLIWVLVYAYIEQGTLHRGVLLYTLFALWAVISTGRQLFGRSEPHPRNDELNSLLSQGMSFADAEAQIRSRYQLLATPRHFRAGAADKVVEYEVKGAIFLVRTREDRVTGWSAK